MQAMDAAEAGGVRLTFFPIGYEMAQNPSLWESALSRGHAIENHTWDHANLSMLSDGLIREEISRHIEALQAIVGSSYHEQFLRPPGGDGIFNYDPRIPAIAEEFGLKIAMWTSDSNGWRLSPRTDQAALDYVYSNVLEHFGPGTIVLQHVMTAASDDVLALPRIIATAKARGYECLTLPAGIR